MIRYDERLEIEAEGRDAAIAEKLAGDAPDPPYSPRSRRRMAFDHGYSRAASLLDQLMRIGK